MAKKQNPKFRIEKPRIQSSEEEVLWRDVAKFAKLIPEAADPNLGRIQEIKDEIRNGTYLTSDKIEETVARLAIRFMRPE